MAYREPGTAQAAASCYRHAAAAANAVCDRCLQPICDLCVIYVRASTHCPICAKKVRRTRAIGRAVTGLALVAIAVAAFLYVRAMPARFDYGLNSQKVTEAREKVQAERCDRRATIALEDLMIASGDNRGALADVDAFVKKCGDFYRVHWSAYTAHHRLSENAAAIADATKLIEHAPGDKDYRWWRGVVYEEMGRDAEAIADFQEAIRLEPEITNIPFNLADILERQGKHCEAKQVIQAFLEHHPDGAEASVLARLAKLTNVGHCAP